MSFAFTSGFNLKATGAFKLEAFCNFIDGVEFVFTFNIKTLDRCLRFRQNLFYFFIRFSNPRKDDFSSWNTCFSRQAGTHRQIQYQLQNQVPQCLQKLGVPIGFNGITDCKSPLNFSEIVSLKKR